MPVENTEARSARGVFESVRDVAKHELAPRVKSSASPPPSDGPRILFATHAVAASFPTGTAHQLRPAKFLNADTENFEL